MDIARPDPEGQVAPAPWYTQNRPSPLENAVQTVLNEQPAATPDEVVARLAAKDIQVPGTFVAAFIAKQQQPPAAR